MHKGDKSLLWLVAGLLIMPILLAYFSKDRFRYPCQDPANWDKDICKMPICDVRRECPEHIFKGQRDPRLGPPTDQPATSKPVASTQGANCGK
jgi:hypothetical protein